jgi:hypothetical protein
LHIKKSSCFQEQGRGLAAEIGGINLGEKDLVINKKGEYSAHDSGSTLQGSRRIDYGRRNAKKQRKSTETIRKITSFNTASAENPREDTPEGDSIATKNRVGRGLSAIYPASPRQTLET